VIERGNFCLGVIRTSSKLRNSSKKVRAVCTQTNCGSVLDTPYKEIIGIKELQNVKAGFCFRTLLVESHQQNTGPVFFISTR
jgi:hypothetical protein